MNTTSSPAHEPGTPHSVNVTVNVNTPPGAVPPSGTAQLPRIVGYAVLGLLVIGFIVGQLVVGGVITFTFP